MATVPTLDLRGLHCPLPVLRTAKRLAGMRPGQSLWIETTDPLAGIDIPAFAREAGHRLAETVRTETGHRFLVERCGSGGETEQRAPGVDHLRPHQEMT